MRSVFSILSVVVLFLGAAFAESGPNPWTSVDIGTATVGETLPTGASGPDFTIKGSGSDIWSTRRHV